MAYEVIFKYYDVNDDGSFNKETPQELKKKYGTLENEYPMDKLMSNITGHLARRDIYVYDVEVYEFLKKQIPFKITKNGLVLKNQRVSYDEMLENNQILAESQNTNNVSMISVNESIQPIRQNKFVDLSNRVENQKNKKPIRYVVFSPPLNVNKAKFNYKFTRNKRYPVFSERFLDTGIGQMLSMVDDAGKDVEVHDEYFVPAGNNLGFDNEMNPSKKDGNIDLLNWQGGNEGNDGVPVLRKGI